jgi:crotonobetainyl-CoA:carnitine CoA-transferase CaiB-like acyl-CoA transferase
VATLPHLAERHAFPTIAHATRGSVRVTATPFHLDGDPVVPQGPAPYRVGEHTRSVLADVLGYAPARIETLLTAGAIATA